MADSENKLDVEKIRELIRDKSKPPEELVRELTAMIEQAHPAAAFADGEKMAMREFVARFKRAFCEGSEVRFWQCRVRILRVLTAFRTEIGIVIMPNVKADGDG